ncbi:MAG TPA: tetratricopeptide repeat protein [Bryobacteraceae bacterium]
MYCKAGRTLVCFLSLILAGCSRQSASTTARIAVLRFENLTPDVSLDWMGRAASEIIAQEIGAGDSVITPGALHANPTALYRPLLAPGESAERSAALAEGATRIVSGQISQVRGHLVVDVTERDPATQKTIRTFTVTSTGMDDLYGVADQAARQISSRLAPFDSKSNPAITAWARALEESDRSKVSTDYETAVQADPGFAGAWLGWARTLTEHGDRAAASKILAEAQQHAGQFSELNRARLKLGTAELGGDRAAVLTAMNEMGRLLPEDADNVRAIGDLNFNTRQFPAAVTAFRRLTALTPKAPLAWNQLGYSLMYTGDYDGAMSALQTYQRLSPGDVNPVDSQGDVAFAFGRFPDAEKLYNQAAAKDPVFQNSADIYKAAMAHLMTGDGADAAKKFDLYLSARHSAKDPLADFRAAQWQFLSGRHSDAQAALEKLAAGGGAPQFRALVLTQKAVWDLQLGKRDLALQDSGAALKTGAAAGNTLIVRFASEDAHGAADWSARADRILSAPQLAQLKPVALAWALFLAREWQAAEPLWKQIVDHAGAEDSLSPAIYAQILVELNRAKEAEPLVRLFPILRPDQTQEFLSTVIPRIFDTKAVVLAAQGRNAEADASRKVFHTLWGN